VKKDTIMTNNFVHSSNGKTKPAPKTTEEVKLSTTQVRGIFFIGIAVGAGVMLFFGVIFSLFGKIFQKLFSRKKQGVDFKWLLQ
jgi:hypothetical protein